jgi:hypothetical protein
MQAKDYLTLLLSSLALLVSFSAYLLNYRTNRKSNAAKAKIDVVEASGRRNDIVYEYAGVMNLINEVRLRFLSWPHPIADQVVQTYIRGTLDSLEIAETVTRSSMNEIRALDPKNIATEDGARSKVEELHGRSKELMAKAAALLKSTEILESQLREKGLIPKPVDSR